METLLIGLVVVGWALLFAPLALLPLLDRAVREAKGAAESDADAPPPAVRHTDSALGRPVAPPVVSADRWAA